MVLGSQGPGRVGRRRFLLTSRPLGGSSSAATVGRRLGDECRLAGLLGRRDAFVAASDRAPCRCRTSVVHCLGPFAGRSFALRGLRRVDLTPRRRGRRDASGSAPRRVGVDAASGGLRDAAGPAATVELDAAMRRAPRRVGPGPAARRVDSAPPCCRRRDAALVDAARRTQPSPPRITYERVEHASTAGAGGSWVRSLRTAGIGRGRRAVGRDEAAPPWSVGGCGVDGLSSPSTHVAPRRGSRAA